MARIIFAGTSNFAVYSLVALANAGHDIIKVLTQPDRPAGRGRKLKMSPIKQKALELGLEVWQPERLGDEFFASYQGIICDFLVVAAYGLIIPQRVLDHPRFGGINVHASLLPLWRGAAPIARAIMAGDLVTGVSIMQMDAGLDTGPVWSQVATEIKPRETAVELELRIAEIGAQALVKELSQWDLGAAEGVDAGSGRKDKPCVQHQLTTDQGDALTPTYAHKIKRADRAIDWENSALVIERQIRGLAGNSGAYFHHQGQDYKVGAVNLVIAGATPEVSSLAVGEFADMSEALYVGCGDNSMLAITAIQRPGGNMLAWPEFAKGNHPFG